MLKSGTLLTLIICLFIIKDSQAQVKESYQTGDTLYRYSSKLERDYRRFQDIRIQYLNFPCVDVYAVKKGSLPGVDIELRSKDLSEYFSHNSTKLSDRGFRGLDPFIGIPGQIVHYTNDFPIVSSTRKDDFYNIQSTEFYLAYKYGDLDDDLKLWCEENNVSEIKILIGLEKKSSYKQNDSFDNLEEVIDGFVIQTEDTYQIKTFEIRQGGQWDLINFREDGLLKDIFSNKVFKYLSFYSYTRLEEIARINLEPFHSFYYNSKTSKKKLTECSYDGVGVYVYPNPTYGELFAKFNAAPKGEYTFSLINIIGKKLWSTAFPIERRNQEVRIDLPALSKGVYLYNVINPDGKRIQSRRLIIVEP